MLLSCNRAIHLQHRSALERQENLQAGRTQVVVARACRVQGLGFTL
jgi:hypothetical protein